jgi:hypothetical protein
LGLEKAFSLVWAGGSLALQNMSVIGLLFGIQ